MELTIEQLEEQLKVLRQEQASLQMQISNKRRVKKPLRFDTVYSSQIAPQGMSGKSLPPKIIVEVIDNEHQTAWRLRMNNETSEWSNYSEGILSHTFKNGETWYYATDYWNTVFPVNTPFKCLPLSPERFQTLKG